MANPSRAEKIGIWLASNDWLAASILSFIFASIAAWSTSVVVSAKARLWLILILDFVAFPVGIVDGVGIWFRLW